MVQEWRPETPTEYDRRKAAPYDFTPVCVIPGCESHGVRAAFCTDSECNAPLMLLCTPHAEIVPMVRGEIKCDQCGNNGHARDVLRVESIAGWL